MPIFNVRTSEFKPSSGFESPPDNKPRIDTSASAAAILGLSRRWFNALLSVGMLPLPIDSYGEFDLNEYDAFRKAGCPPLSEWYECPESNPAGREQLEKRRDDASHLAHLEELDHLRQSENSRNQREGGAM